MPKPPASFILHRLYKGEVQIKFLDKSHTYKVYDPAYKRDWLVSPSATGLTDKMEKGAGLMMYAMSEAMKHMDHVLNSRSLKSIVEDESFTLQNLFKEARKAHITKSNLGKRVGTKSHEYVEALLRAFKTAQDRRTQFIVPPVPRAADIATELNESWQKMLGVFTFNKVEDTEKFKQVVVRDIEVRSLLWQEALMIQRACDAAREFFVSAARQGTLKVWAVEQLVHSREHFFSGKFDCILEFMQPFSWRGYTIGAGVYVTDFKTSNPAVDYPMGIFPNHLAQVGLYDVAYCEEFPQVKDRITGHLILGSSKHGDGFHPYVSLKRERNRRWGIALVPVMEYMHQGEKELKGLNLYGGGK